MESVELLSVLNQTGGAGKRWERRRKTSTPKATTAQRESNSSAAKLPKDSRVPKSSSLPTKLAKKLTIVEDEDEFRERETKGK